MSTTRTITVDEFGRSVIGAIKHVERASPGSYGERLRQGDLVTTYDEADQPTCWRVAKVYDRIHTGHQPSGASSYVYVDLEAA